MLSELWSGLSMGVKMTEAEYAKKSLKEHEGIVESMKKCDTMEAAMKMHQHIERSLEDVLTVTFRIMHRLTAGCTMVTISS